MGKVFGSLILKYKSLQFAGFIKIVFSSSELSGHRKW